MTTDRRSILLAVVCVGLCTHQALASNLANPATPIPSARAAVGLSYNLGFHTITKDTIPCLMNRVHARFSFSPISFFNLGIDAGASQMDVAADTSATDTFGVFNGKMGFSGGAHVKLSTPFLFNDLLALVAIGQGTYFSSENENSAVYGGFDIAGGGGLQFHVPKFGYITAGAQMYLILGKNKDYLGAEGEYSNSNNIRGWLAIDFFPSVEIMGESNPYISIEVSVSPEVGYNDRTPLREIGFSVSFGTVTKRLYGEETGVEWEP